MPPSYGGPQLPRDLLDKIGGGPKRKDNNSTRGGRRNLPTTRKDQRKQDRVQKRYVRNGAVQKPSRSTLARSNSGGWPVKALVSDDDLDEDDLDDSIKTTQPTAKAAPVLKSALKASTKAAPIPVPPAPAKSTSASQLQPSKANKQPPTSRVSKAMQEKLARDDAEIAALEKKLGMKGGKGLGKSFEDEGLAELLGDLEGTDDTIGSKSKRKSSADREWLQSKRRKIAPGVQEEEQDDEDSEDDDADSFGENDDETRPEDDASAESDGEEGDLMEFDDGDIVDIDLDAEPPSDDSEDLEDDDNGSDEDDIEGDDMQGLGNEVVEDKDDELEDDDDLGFASEDEKDGVEEGAPKRAREVDDDEDLGLDSDDAEEAPPKRARENPYIAPGTTGDKPSGKYIPPSLRAPTTSDAELAGRLKRQVQGLLNRLSEANIISILGEVELLYQNSPRQYVTSTLIDLLLGLICDRSTLNDTFLILHAGFIAAVYKVIGPDFGAQMIERVVEGFDRYYTKEENDEAGRKECTNLMSLLAQLYNLQVIGSELVFEYIRSFLDSLTELHTELLLRVVRTSGYQLRQDDSSSLKDIVLLLQRAVTAAGPETLSVRTKFMIDTVNDLKNNKLKAGVAQSALTTDHLIRMRKTLGTLNVRNVKVTEPMRIGLADIRDTDKRGKWWLVGASWKGRDRDAQHSALSVRSEDVEDQPEDEDASGEPDLLLLARNMGMNTDIRRAIFVTIMSAVDYKDAQLKLLKLNLTRTQQVEIPRVLLHCVGAAQHYNPFYAVLARQYCSDHKLRKAFTFVLWSLFKKLGERGPDDDAASSEDEDDEQNNGTGLAGIVNQAQFFARLIATGGLDLSMLKHLDLVYLQPKTRAFLEVMLFTVLLQVRSSSKSAKVKKGSSTPVVSLRAVLESTYAHPQIVTGLQWFLRKVVAKTALTKDDKEKAKLKKACKEATSMLITAGQNGPDA